MTNSNAIIELIKTIVCEHTKRENLRELCFTFRQDRSLTIGGRQLLIEEINEEVFDAKCIQIIFAASSDYICTEGFESNIENMDKLKKMLDSRSCDFDIEKWLSETVKDKLKHSNPSVSKVSYIDYRLEQGT